MENEKTNCNNDVMTEAEASRFLKICTKTLRKLRKLKQIPYAETGKKIVYLRPQLLAWLASGGTAQFGGGI